MKLIYILSFLTFTFGHYYLISSYAKLFSLPIQEYKYSFPTIFSITITAILFFSYKISFALYSYIYYITTSYFVFIIHLIFALIFYYILLILFTPITIVKFPIVIIIPFIYCLYQLIQARIIYIDKIKLKCKGIKHITSIAHLSDLHLGELAQRNFVETVVSKVKELNPNIVVITGDLVDRASVPIQRNWFAPFDTLDIPVLYVTGNHEKKYGKKDIIDIIKTTKIQYICNTIHHCEGINFIGVEYKEHIWNLLQSLSYKIKNRDIVNIVLCHVPQMKPEYLEQYNVFLYLGGHTHGGQIFPFHLDAYLRNACFAGLYKSKKGNNYVYVSSGVGTGTLPIRSFSRSVIGFITLIPE